MIVLTCVFRPTAGHGAECEIEAKKLMEVSRQHEGLLVYQWTADDETGDLVLVEVHEDEESVHNHIALTDISALTAHGSITRVRVQGEALSARLREVLAGFGHFHPYRAL